ncbi:MAG: nucleoside-diphosphate-sugar epimerase [Gammaproteobacteria bacterium]|jgi:nucleoside-diphosphate-sugar epimerase
MPDILVTGASGQLGTELTAALRVRFGSENVLATGRHLPEDPGPAEILDVTDVAAIEDTIGRHGIRVIYHLAARLSVVAERDPVSAWQINVDGLRNMLEAARSSGVDRMFWPSSIAAFGPETPRDEVPQDTVTRPTTIYGIAKVAGELLCDYYYRRYDLDVRGVRYPGVISSGSAPGGGTTDYAVEIFYAALAQGRYSAFVREDCRLPMIYMPDCIRAAIMLMDAAPGRLKHRNGFNLAAMSFTAGELAAEIQKHIPKFSCAFEPDERQVIADSWPSSLDDSAARSEWDWHPEFDLAGMTADMLATLRQKMPD